MVLMVFFSSRISPRTSTVILRDRSPLATAVVTSAMLRTWAVRLPAMELTLNRSDPSRRRRRPSLRPGRPVRLRCRLRAPRASLRDANAFSWSTMVLMVFFSSRISPRTSTVILRERSPLATAVVTSAMLRTCAVRLPAMELTLSVKILPDAADAFHLGLAAQLAFRAHFARHARHFARRSS